MAYNWVCQDAVKSTLLCHLPGLIYYTCIAYLNVIKVNKSSYFWLNAMNRK